MDEFPVVFASKITRGEKPLKNDLWNLLRIDPAVPIKTIRDSVDNGKVVFDFQPKGDKHYVSKKKPGGKVKTVRDIRNLFEIDVYGIVQSDIEKQERLLLRKIKNGSSNTEKTKTFAKSILKCDNPISRSSWHMLMHINPEEQKYSSQYVLWNGRLIRVNGSKGGPVKFVANQDLGKSIKLTSKILVSQKKQTHNKTGILRNSLRIKFKPGPLSKKHKLDDSYQKYHIGKAELVSLPKLGLEIEPKYNAPLNPVVSNYLQSCRDVNGTISKQWAEFAISMLGKFNGKIPEQICKPYITFDLNYVNGQNFMLMRQGSEDKAIKNVDIDRNMHDTSDITFEINKIMNELLQSVEISIMHDTLFTEDDCSSYIYPECFVQNSNNSIKDKTKRKYAELDRLAVTVIRLTGGNEEKNRTNACSNDYCALGCICSSLQYSHNIKQHCGRLQCMFDCKCDYSNSNVNEYLQNVCCDLIPGLMNLDKQANLNLAKEEQKFHQTVIVSDEESIMLKTRKRNGKTSQRYADFLSNLKVKKKDNIIKALSIVTLKLNCHNIEPWCMVHNLYKCFCKGKFSKSSFDIDRSLLVEKENTVNETIDETREKDDQPQVFPRSRRIPKTKFSDSSDSNDSFCIDQFETCARIVGFNGRRYKNKHYLDTNLKISQMENNDDTLRSRLLYLVRKDQDNCESPKNKRKRDLLDDNDLSNDSQDIGISHTYSSGDVRNLKSNGDNQKVMNHVDNSTTETNEDKGEKVDQSLQKIRQNKTNLVSWLEKSYKDYKKLAQGGMVKPFLESPKVGKVALHPWEFILNRYKERKNHFMISTQPPFRIFMAVKTNNPLFKNCININDIRFADLNKYPITVKNLLTNANTSEVKDNFCILNGLVDCWEVIGSVTKLKPSLPKNENIDEDSSPELKLSLEEKDDDEDNYNELFSMSNATEVPHISKPKNKECDSSKWFIMTIENDFSEIQFYKKGFFVKHESIVKAIKVARTSGKTVRLSSQKCSETIPQFGIYAIPNVNEFCIFIGPYEKDEALGIETVKTTVYSPGKNRTRGVWITTNKIDNLKVIDNPLSFIPSENKTNVTVDRTEETVLNKSQPSSVTTKTVRPIKIRKTSGGFYHLSSVVNTDNSLLCKDTGNDLNNSISKVATDCTASSNIRPNYISVNMHKPVAEIAPQIKITNVTSQAKTNSSGKTGMFILKPEEINKRSLENKFSQVRVKSEDEIDEDIENFLATSLVCARPSSDIRYEVSNANDIHPWEEVCIYCKNIDNLGWIQGRRNDRQELSFEFPGFKYTNFYNIDEAFQKINQVLSRKIYVPAHIKLVWEVVDINNDIISNKTKLNQGTLGRDFILTKHGLRHKTVLLTTKRLKDTAGNSKNKKVETATSMMLYEEIDKELNDESDFLLSQLHSINEASSSKIMRNLVENTDQETREKMNTLLNKQSEKEPRKKR